MKSSLTTDLSVILPVYNDAAALAAFLPELLQWLASQGRCEVIVVDDGSRDDVRSVCTQAVLPKDTALRLLTLSRNFGKEAALSAGLSHARGEAVANRPDLVKASWTSLVFDPGQGDLLRYPIPDTRGA